MRLSIENVVRRAGEFTLGPITLDIAAPITAIVGPSGSGKTTLLSIIAGLIPAHAGTVRYDGRDIATISDRERAHARRDHIAVAMQQPYFFPDKEVPASVRLGIRAGAYPRELSGGELSRANIARAFSRAAEIVLLDEPTAMLDEISAARVIDLIVEESRGRRIVVATHDDRLIRHADEVVRLV